MGEPTALAPRQPVDVADELRGPVLGLYGGADTGIGQDTVERMKAALAAAGGAGHVAAAASQLVVYPDAPHAFHADYRPSYRAAAAQDGWQRMLAGCASMAWPERHANLGVKWACRPCAESASSYQ